MLFTHWERRYLNFSRTMPVTEEGLLFLFMQTANRWVQFGAFAHDSRRRSGGAEDLRLLERTSRFASAACQVLESIENSSGWKTQRAAKKRKPQSANWQTGWRRRFEFGPRSWNVAHGELAEANEDLRFQVGPPSRNPCSGVDAQGLMGRRISVNRNWLEYSGQTLDYVQP